MSVPESNSFAVLSEPHVLTEAANRAGNPSGWRDMLGVVASIACAIHCAAMPFVIGFLPAMGLGFLADEAFHKWMAGACFLIGLAAFIPGWKRHGQLLPAGIAAAAGFVAGQTRYFQVTHRDDAAQVCMRGLNTSQAVEMTFTP